MTAANPGTGTRPEIAYLAAYFLESSTQLHFGISRDGTHWTPIGGTVEVLPYLRDPSIMRYQNEWWVAYTGESPADDVNAFPFDHVGIGHGSVPSAVAFSHTVDTSTATTGTSVKYTWAPEWYVDGATTYLIVATSTDNNLDAGASANFTTWAIPATNAALTTWGTPVKMDFGVASWIDCYVVKIGATYHAFPKKDVRSNHNLSLIYHFTASTFPGGPWTQVHTGAQVTPDEAVSGHAEAANIISLGGNSWRLYYDKHDAGGVCKYVESYDNFATFASSCSTVVTTDAVRHASVVDASTVPSLRTAYHL